MGAHGYEEHDYDSGDGGTTYRGDGVPDNLLGRSATDGFPFMHTGARYYDPSTGRFLQRDPIGIRGGLNVYVYCGNNPVIRIDPNGMKFGWSEVWGVGKILLGLGCEAGAGVAALTGHLGIAALLAGGGLYLLYDGISDVWPTATKVTQPVAGNLCTRNNYYNDIVDNDPSQTLPVPGSPQPAGPPPPPLPDAGPPLDPWQK